MQRCCPGMSHLGAKSTHQLQKINFAVYTAAEDNSPKMGGSFAALCAVGVDERREEGRY